MDKVLETVLSKLDYIPTKDILVKPLEEVYVEKEIIKPVDTGKKDSDGYNINDTETVKEKVLATFKKGIVLSIPSGYEWQDKDNHPEVGDTIVYARKHAIDFDLFKDSQLVKTYDVIAIKK